MIYQRFHYFVYVALSGGILPVICDVTTVQLSNGTVHKFLQNVTFVKICNFPLLLYLGMLGL